MATIAQPLQPAPSLELALRHILGRNLALRLLLAGGYRWTAVAITLALGYFGTGLAIAFFTNSLPMFLLYRPVYIILLGIVLAVLSACWYPPLLIEVIAAVPRAFVVDQQTIEHLVEQWAKYIRLPIPLIIAFITIIIGVLYSITHETSLSIASTWFTVYRVILFSSGYFILGGGIEVFLLTILLFHKIFQYKLNLAHYRHLHPLNTLSTGLTILSLTAVSLFVFLIFFQIDLSTLLITGLGILGALIMFIVPQVSYQGAVVRAKRAYLHQIDILYEQYYRVIEHDSVTPGDLKETKEAVEALETLEKSIKSIPLWLIDLSDVSKISLSVLAPIVSLIINTLLTKWI